MRGVDCLVISKKATATDAHGNPVYTESSELVSDVMVHPASTSTDRDGKAQQAGVTTELSIAFPKTYTGSLEGCLLAFPTYGEDIRWQVIDNPLITPGAPTRWNRNVRAVKCDG